jgi:hypothetical protein
MSRSFFTRNSKGLEAISRKDNTQLNTLLIRFAGDLHRWIGVAPKVMG